MALDNREIALLIWLALGIGCALSVTWGKPTLSNLVRAFFQKPILVVLGLTLTYIAASVWLVSRLGWWQWSNLKTTVIWTIGFAFVAIFNFQKIETWKTYFRRTLREAISVTAIVAFIAATYTFSLPVELILSGVLIFLAMISAVSERDKRFNAVHTIASVVLVILGLLMLGESVYHIATGFREFVTPHTAREFFTPILLTVLLLPYLYAIRAYSVCENVLVVLKHQTHGQELTRYAAFKLIWKLRLDLTAWGQWQQHVGLFPPKNRSDVDAAVDEVKKARRRQRRPYRVQLVPGWLPDQAVTFLASNGLATGHYHRNHVDWSASSRYLDVGGWPSPNNVAYYITGNEFTASELKLVLNINEPESAEEACEHFFGIVTALIKAAIPGALRDGKELLINAGDPPLLVQGHEITLERIDWPRHVKGGRELVFTITTITADRASDGPTDSPA